MRHFSLWVAIGLLLCSVTFDLHGADDLQQRLAAAKPGDTIELPEGEFSGPIELPSGVSLKGAGFEKTIINASGVTNGIVIKDQKGVTLSDLAVRGATGADILVRGGSGVVVRRVRATGGLLGISLNDTQGSRVENSISDVNSYGIVLSGGEANVVVNCTLANNASVGLSLSSGKGSVAFNNCITDSLTEVYVGADSKDVSLDYNLYLGRNIGKLGSQVARATMNDWRYLSGYDAHSVALPIKYEDAAHGRFKTVSTLDWALDRPTTAGWGVTTFAGQNAPTADLTGQARPARPALGAYESTVSSPRPADGTFEVSSGEGITSAGVFDSQGKLVAYLFQGLPLPAGKYSFWLPSRSWKGREIAPGEYEVRLTESKLDWQYRGWVANTTKSEEPSASCPVDPKAVAFDNNGQLISGRGWSEAGDSIRAFDGATGKEHWVFRGAAFMHGLVLAEDGKLYTLRSMNNKTRLTRIDPATGNIAPWSDTDYGQFFFLEGNAFNGLATLGDKLWYSDGPRNAIWLGSLNSPTPTIKIDVPAPASPAADTKTKVVWVISGNEKIVAISPEGKIVAESQIVPQPAALAARDGRLAIASKKTGKIHFFDASDPAQLKPLSTLGRGDGPDGRILSDRFLFQEGACTVCLALGPQQELVVGEEGGRLQVFDRDNKLTWSAFSTGGWAIFVSKVTPGRAFVGGGFTLMLDSESGKWEPESYHRAIHQEIFGEFQVEGKNFVAINDRLSGVSFVEFTPDKATPTIGLICPWGSNDPWTYREDSNHDGFINVKDAVVANVLDANGQLVARRRIVAQTNNIIWPNGDLVTPRMDGWFTRWPCAGLDKKGFPLYRFADRVSVPNAKSDLVSPYDLKPVANAAGEVAQRPGGWVATVATSSNPANKKILLGGGADVVGIDADGEVDWLRPFGQYPGAPMVGTLDMGVEGMYIASLAETYDFMLLDSNGLELQGFSFPSRAHYQGHWVDHVDTVSTFVDKQGRVNLLTTDYMTSRNHWFTLRQKDIRESKTKFQVNPNVATALAALPPTSLDVESGQPKPTNVRVPKLKAPLAIDGDLKKWRDLEIEPRIIITPETSSGIDGGPKDCSAVVRLAYLDQDLYVQVLRFDDLLTNHQPLARGYQQDGIELCVNGIMNGVKFNIAKTTDAGLVNHVDGWGIPGLILDKKNSPLVIKKLDNANEVTERQLIENIFGVNLRDSKVQVYETKIPFDAKTFAKRPEARIELKSGQTFYLGLLINDNDQPGTDVQGCLAWPPTFGLLSPVESGARVELE